MDQNFVVISEIEPEGNRRTLPIFYLSTTKRKSELYMEKSLLKVQGLSKNLSAYNLHLFGKNGGKNIHTYIQTYIHTYICRCKGEKRGYSEFTLAFDTSGIHSGINCTSSTFHILDHFRVCLWYNSSIARFSNPLCIVVSWCKE